MQSKIYIDKEGNLSGLADDILDMVGFIGQKQVARVSDVEYNHASCLWEARDLEGALIASGPVRSHVIDAERKYFNSLLEQKFTTQN
jgi:hypothetical protein